MAYKKCPHCGRKFGFLDRFLGWDVSHVLTAHELAHEDVREEPLRKVYYESELAQLRQIKATLGATKVPARPQGYNDRKTQGFVEDRKTPDTYSDNSVNNLIVQSLVFSDPTPSHSATNHAPSHHDSGSSHSSSYHDSGSSHHSSHHSSSYHDSGSSHSFSDYSSSSSCDSGSCSCDF